MGGVLGILFVVGVVWAVASRVKREGDEESYEQRDN